MTGSINPYSIGETGEPPGTLLEENVGIQVRASIAPAGGSLGLYLARWVKVGGFWQLSSTFTIGDTGRKRLGEVLGTAL